MKLLLCKFYDAKSQVFKAVMPEHYLKQNLAVATSDFSKSRQRKIAKNDLINFWEHLAACLSSGVPLHEAIRLFPINNSKNWAKILVKTIELQLDIGYKLSEILGIFTKSFDEFSLTIIKTSELNGDYYSASIAISQHLKWQQNTRKNIIRSLRYPGVVFVILMIAVVILMNYVIPEISKFISLSNNNSTYYEDISYLLTLVVQLLMALIYGAIGLTLAYFGIGLFSNAPRMLKDKILFYLPFVGEFTRSHAYCSYFYVIGQSLSSGANLQDSLNIAEKSIKNLYLLIKARDFKQMIKNGTAVSLAADALPGAPNILKASLRQAEINGKISEILKQLAINLGNRYQQRIDTFASGLGPAMTVFIGLIILGIVLTVLYPIYDNIGNLDA